jgi:hypothetical protein
MPFMFVDAGDFTGDPTPAGRKQTDALVEAMNGMGYRVAAFSQRELGNGYEAFEAIRTRASFPFVSANIVWQDTAQPVVDPFVVLKVALREQAKARDVRIAFMGLTGNNPAFLKNGPDGRRIVTTDPIAAAVKYAPEMRSKSDLVVVLSSLDLDTARNVARAAKDIDLILGAAGPIQSRSDDFPEDSVIGHTRLQAIGDQGKNLGEIRLTFGDKRSIASVQRVVNGLTREWPDAPAMAQLMNSTKEAVNEMNRAQAEAQSPFATGPGARPQPAVEVTGAPSYTGSARCQPCHAEQFAIWSGSKHAHAFDILVTNKQDFNPTCVGCHTIGYGRPLGFVSAAATPGLEHVGCESCHGPSSQHPDHVGKGYGVTSTDRCRDCHTANNSPDFDPATYIPKVRHWKDAGAGAR